MNKKLLSIMLSAAMTLSATTAIFAEEQPVLISDSVNTQTEEAVEVFATYNKTVVKGSFVSVEESQIIIKADETELAINTDENTIFVDESGAPTSIEAVKENTVLNVVADLKTTMSIPAQRYGYVVMVAQKADAEFPIYVEVKEVKEEDKNTVIVSADGEYNVIPSDETVYTPVKSRKIVKLEDIKAGSELLIIADKATASIPAVLNPSKVIVFEEKVAEEVEDNQEEVKEEAVPSYVSFADLTVKEVSEDRLVTESADKEEIILNTHKAVTYKNDGTEVKEIKAGDVVTAFVGANEPATLALPAAYTPAVIIVNDAEVQGFVEVSTFVIDTDSEDIRYINTEKDLVVYPSADHVMNKKAENDYIVFYTTTTRSIPPQTTASKMILLETTEEVEVTALYSDVKEDNEYYENIVSATEKGLLNGVGDGKFGPEMNMTRAMFVTVLGRLDGFELEGEIKTGFDDTKDDAYYSQYIAWANDNGVVKGYGDGKFMPDKEVSREEAMQILYNYCNYKEIKFNGEVKSADYSDADKINPVFKDAVEFNKQFSFLHTGDNNDINPSAMATRAEVAGAIDTLYGIVNEVIEAAAE